MKTFLLQLTAIFLLLFSMQPFMAQTPVLVKDINPLGDSKPENFFEFNGKLFFRANDGVHGIELWVSDGTPEGTKMLKDINPDGHSMPRYFTELNSLLYFRAECSSHGVELWVTDGTEAGTRLVKDIHPGVGSSSKPEAQYFTYESWPFTIFNDKLFFAAENGTHGLELWASDGTEAGTYMVKDIAVGGYGSSPYYLNGLKGKLYFSADNGTTNGRELWVTDGTAANTILVKDLRPGQYSSNPSSLTLYNDMIYFSAKYKPFTTYPETTQLFVTDGTVAGTDMFKILSSDNSDPRDFIVFNNKLIFCAKDYSKGYELWVSDGTILNTFILKDLNPGSGNGSPHNLTISCGKLFFSANNGNNGFQPWVTDGTEEGTNLLKVLNSNAASNPDGFTEFNGLTWFVARDDDYYFRLFVTDGTEAGTRAINLPETDNDYYGFDSKRTQLFAFNGELYFSAGYDEKGEELYKIDNSLSSDNELMPSKYPVPSIFPNPATNHFYIESENEVTGLEIYTLTGSLVSKVREPVYGAVSTSGMAKGIYILMIHKNNKSYSQKLIIK